MKRTPSWLRKTLARVLGTPATSDGAWNSECQKSLEASFGIVELAARRIDAKEAIPTTKVMKKEWKKVTNKLENIEKELKEWQNEANKVTPSLSSLFNSVSKLEIQSVNPKSKNGNFRARVRFCRNRARRKEMVCAVIGLSSNIQQKMDLCTAKASTLKCSTLQSLVDIFNKTSQQLLESKCQDNSKFSWFDGPTKYNLTYLLTHIMTTYTTLFQTTRRRLHKLAPWTPLSNEQTAQGT